MLVLILRLAHNPSLPLSHSKVKILFNLQSNHPQLNSFLKTTSLLLIKIKVTFDFNSLDVLNQFEDVTSPNQAQATNIQVLN